MDFSSQTVIVSGAASGMGLLFSQRFVQAGGQVVMADQNAAEVRRQADLINRSYKERAVASGCDIRDYNQVSAVARLAIMTFGHIDVLINFAGGAETRIWGVSDREFPDVPIEVYDWGIDVNLKGQLHFAHAVLGQMRRQQHGVILNIGSITGEEGCATNVAYAAAKSGAMYGLTRSLAKYGATCGVRCCCLSPGPVLTRPGMRNMKTALGRAARPEEIVNMALYIVSQEGAFLDGVNILMDGGRNILNNRD
ncbi:MAG: SDR family NAD(P)-dependent oxidoreductase [Oscillospiraceae bacterium]|nr:SDR family NAD(P)-dependent oxidoreductase [Oscillospiraceae bacterium]